MLQYITMDMQSYEDCQLDIPEVQSYHMCAIDESSGGAPCTFDEGGPLSFEGNGTGTTLAGIFSFNDRCRSITPSVFTSIPYYREWIREVTGV